MSPTARNQFLKCASALSSAGLVVAYCVFLTPLWHVNDDIGILFFATGVLDGNPTWQIPYVAPIAAALIRLLTAILGPAGYGILLVSLLYASFWELTSSIAAYCSAKRSFPMLVPVAAVIVNLVALFVTLQNLSFTTVAGVSSTFLIASTCLRADALSHTGHRRVFWGAALLFVAYSLRPGPSLIALTILVPLWLRRTTQTRWTVTPLAFIGAWLVNNSFELFRSPTYQEWHEFNIVRGSLHGNRRLSETSSAMLDEVGWSTNDFNLFRSFLHFDALKFNVDSLRVLQGLLGTDLTSQLQQLSSARLVESLTLLRELALFIALATMVVVLKANKLSRLHLILSGRLLGTLALALVIANSLSGIRLPFRIESTILLATIMSALCILMIDNPDPHARAGDGASFVPRASSRSAGVSIFILASVLSLQAVRLHTVHLSDHLSTRTERVEASLRHEHVAALLKGREADEITLVMPGTEVLQLRSPVSRSEIYSSGLIRFGWSVGSPGWESRNRLLGIDVRDVLLRSQEPEGSVRKISILSFAYPKVISTYIFEETGQVPSFEPGPCAATDNQKPCLWVLSK